MGSTSSTQPLHGHPQGSQPELLRTFSPPQPQFSLPRSLRPKVPLCFWKLWLRASRLRGYDALMHLPGILFLLSSGCYCLFKAGKPVPDTETITVDCSTAYEWLADGVMDVTDCEALCKWSGLRDITVTHCERLSLCNNSEDSGDTGMESQAAMRVTCDGIQLSPLCE